MKPQDFQSGSSCPQKNKPGFLIWELANLWQRSMKSALGSVDITHVQFFILGALQALSQDNPSVMQVDLARHMRLNVMMTSKVIRTLVSKKLVKRIQHPTDTRAKCLQLTPLGVQRIKDATDLVESLHTKFFASAPVDIKQFVDELKTLLVHNQINTVDFDTDTFYSL